MNSENKAAVCAAWTWGCETRITSLVLTLCPHDDILLWICTLALFKMFFIFKLYPYICDLSHFYPFCGPILPIYME